MTIDNGVAISLATVIGVEQGMCSLIRVTHPDGLSANGWDGTAMFVTLAREIAQAINRR